jgi:hypothetical protein
VGTNFLAIEFTASGYKYSINGSDPVEVVTPVSVGLFSNLLVGTCSGNTSLGGHVSLLAYTPRTGLNLKSLTQAGNVELDFAANEYLIGSADLSGPTQISVPFSSVLNFVRISDGWGFDSSGNLLEYAPNTPRFVYDPVTGAPRGFLSEVQRAQLLENTEVRSGAGWSSAGTGPPTLTNLDLNVWGAFRGCRVASGGSIADATQSSVYAVTSGTTYCMQALVQVGTSGRIRLVPVLLGSTNIVLTGTPGALTQTGSTGGTAEVLRDADLGGGFRWIAVRFVPNFTDSVRCRIGPDSTTAGEDIIAIAAQVEAGSVPTSLIISEGLATTRTRDELTIPLTFPGYNPNEGTWIIEWEKDLLEPASVAAIEISSADNNRIRVETTSLGTFVRLFRNIAGDTATSSGLGVDFSGQKNRVAFTTVNGICHASANGGAAASFDCTGLNVSAFDVAHIGCRRGFTNYANATFPRINYYPVALTASQLPVMSAL